MIQCLECSVELILYVTWTAQAKNSGVSLCRDCNHKQKARVHSARRYQTVTKPARHAQGLSKPKSGIVDPLDSMPMNPRLAAMMTPEVVAALSQAPKITHITLTRQ